MNKQINKSNQNNFEEAKQLFTKYMIRKNWSKRTIESYTDNLNQFLDFILLMRKEYQIKEISSKDIACFQNYLFYYKDKNNKNYAIKTQLLKLGTIRSFFNFLQEDNRIIINPAKDMELPREEKRLGRRALKEKEVEKILNVIDDTTLIGYRDKVIINLFYATGIRVDELLNLKLDDVKFEDSLLIIEKGKGNKERRVPLCQLMKNYLNEYMTKVRPFFLKSEQNNQNYLFINKDGSRIHQRQTINIRVKQYCRKAGIKDSIGTHHFRVTCATAMLKGGADERYVKELLGHRDLKSTEQYLKLEIKGLKDEHLLRHPREQAVLSQEAPAPPTQ